MRWRLLIVIMFFILMDLLAASVSLYIKTSTLKTANSQNPNPGAYSVTLEVMAQSSCVGGCSQIEMQNYLRCQKSPVADHVPTLIEAGRRNNVDPRFIIAALW